MTQITLVENSDSSESVYKVIIQSVYQGKGKFSKVF